jgi:hypothetical protein
MAILTPVIGLFSDECNIEIGSGAVDAVAGDVLLFSDIAATLAAAGYGWTASYERYSAPYATDREAEAAFDWNNGNWTLFKDRFVINDPGPAPTNFGVPAFSHADVVRQTQRAATIKFRNPQAVEGVATNANARASLASIGALLNRKCDLKPWLLGVYATTVELIEAFGDECVTWSVGLGGAPNLQPAYYTFNDGSAKGLILIQPYGGDTGYSYLTIDAGWSGAR